MWSLYWIIHVQYWRLITLPVFWLVFVTFFFTACYVLYYIWKKLYFEKENLYWDFSLEWFLCECLLKGVRSRNFRQFQHWSNGHRINWNITKTAQNYRRSQTKHRKDKKGHGWTKLERIKVGCIWVNLKNVGPPFFKFISVYIKMSFTQLENHSLL